MRLSVVENGHRRMQKVLFAIARKAMGSIPGPILTMSYRPELCGKKMAICFQEGMRENREWQVGDVELFAAFVSKLNRCQY